MAEFRCTRCGLTKDVTEFHVCSGRRMTHCKKCRCAYISGKQRETTAERRALGRSNPVGRPSQARGLSHPLGRPRRPRRVKANAAAADHAPAGLTTI